MLGYPSPLRHSLVKAPSLHVRLPFALAPQFRISYAESKREQVKSQTLHDRVPLRNINDAACHNVVVRTRLDDFGRNSAECVVSVLLSSILLRYAGFAYCVLRIGDRMVLSCGNAAFLAAGLARFRNRVFGGGRRCRILMLS